MKREANMTFPPQSALARPLPLAVPGVESRFLSEADCHDIMQRVARFATGGGYSSVAIISACIRDVRWVRNQISAVEEVSNHHIVVQRNLYGAVGTAWFNDMTDGALSTAVCQAERLAGLKTEALHSDLFTRLPLDPSSTPQLFSEETYQLDTTQRVGAAVTSAQSAAEAGMLSAGYLRVAGQCVAVLDSLGHARYFPYTQAQYSVTVRDPKGTGSGWAGSSGHVWSLIDGPKLSALALNKCLTSRAPVVIEPGRYTTILEPQAVCDFVGRLMYWDIAGLGRTFNENDFPGPFQKTPPHYPQPGYSMLGERIVDERITIRADPMDPELGFPPFSPSWGLGGSNLFDIQVFHPVTWIEHGVLTHLAFDREYGIRELGLSTGLPNSGAFRMSGGETSVEEMIGTTKRGLLITRFDAVLQLNLQSLLYRGYTRDGVWLIENGKISKPGKNMTFTESILFALNNIEQLGVPQRVFHPKEDYLWTTPQPVIVPPLKIKDFSFTSLLDSV